MRSPDPPAAAMAVTEDSPDTCTGTVLVAVSPFAHWPFVADPHARTVPSERSA